jgi:circadian clock protein KaiC
MQENQNDVSRTAPTGIAGLDKILQGGLPRNRLYLVAGDPGTGKTTFALQFLLEGVRRGERGLYVTLSETAEELTAVAESHGWSLEGIHIYDLAIPEEAILEDQYTLYHPSEVELGTTTKAILDEVKRLEPQRVVFDSLSEMRLLARDPLRYRRQILSLKQFFIGRKSTVLLLDDHTSRESDRQLESLAHGVVILEHSSPGYGGSRRQLTVRKLRGVNYVSGFHNFNITTGGIVLYPRLVPTGQYASFERTRLTSGIPNLDLLTGGGLAFGSTTLIMGPAGSGKSSIAAQYAVSAASIGEKAAIFIFDETKTILLDRMRGLGINLADEVEKGKCVIHQVDPSDLTPGQFSDMVCQDIEGRGVKVVIIDSLNGYLQAMPEEKFLTANMHDMLGYLNQQGILTILILAQHGLMGSHMLSPVDLTYLADSVVLLRYFENSGSIYKAISVIKSRVGFHESAIREFRMSSRGIEVGKVLTEFQGVLTGVPAYTGEKESLMDGNDGNIES